MKRTEIAAQAIFERNHQHVLGELKAANLRVDKIEAYHTVQKEMYDKLFAQNEEAIIMHNEVKRIFKEESEAFF